MNAAALTIFFDSQCPLCVSEMQQLQALDRLQLMDYADLQQNNFEEQYPGIDREQASRILHGRLSNGKMLYGLDVTCMAWSLVGKHRWLFLIRLPVIRWFADACYRVFARYRYSISWLLTGKSRCKQCSVDSTQCSIEDT